MSTNSERDRRDEKKQGRSQSQAECNAVDEAKLKKKMQNKEVIKSIE